MLKGVRELRVFLASPGDVASERNALRATEQRVNVAIEASGYRIRFLGWEDTAPGLGRPQSLINPDVDACDIFIGVLAKRWGMPSGEDYDSGFHEEFERVVRRVEGLPQGGNRGPAQPGVISDAPLVAIYFKRLPRGDIDDAGPQLQRVLAFRDEIIQNKVLLFGEWTDASDLVQQVVDLVHAHVFRLVAGAAELTDQGAVGDGPASEPVAPVGVGAEELDEARTQLSLVLRSYDAVVRGQEVDDLDSDRLELLARAFGREKDFLGAHLVNRLYRRRDSIVLSVGEHALWAKSFFADAAVQESDRVIPGWGVVLGGDLRGDWVDGLVRDVVALKWSSTTTGLLRVLEATNSLPKCLWEPGTEKYDPSLWGEILEAQPDMPVLLDYLFAGSGSDSGALVLSQLEARAQDPVTASAVRALARAVDREDPDFSELALVAAVQSGPAIVELLGKKMRTLSLEALFAAATSTTPLAHPAVAELSSRGGITAENVQRLLRRADGPTNDAIVEAAVFDPSILSEIEKWRDGPTGPKSIDLDPLVSRIRAAVVPVERLRAEVAEVPWRSERLEALMLAEPEAMMDTARRILDDDALQEREAVRALEGKLNTSTRVEDFVAQQLRSSACRLLARCPGHLPIDAVRVAREVIRSDKLNSADILLILATMATKADLPMIESELSPRLSKVTGYWIPSDIELMLNSRLGPFLAAAWRSSDVRELNEAAHVWLVENGQVKEPTLVEYLSDERPNVRMAACHMLIREVEARRLADILDRYQAGANVYWYNVVCALDRHLFLAAQGGLPLKASEEPAV